MEFKTKNLKGSSTNIQYVRSCDASNDTCKSKNCLKFIFQYKTSFIAAIFSIVLLILFIIMMIYVMLESERFVQDRHESFTPQKKKPISSQISLTLDSKANDVLLDLSTNEKLIWSDLSTSQNFFKTNRLKRQISQNSDCRTRHDECKIILDNIKGITESMQEKLDRLYGNLVNQGILKESDPKEAKFRKIVECLQCRNSIDHKEDDYGDNDSHLSDFSRNANDHISNVLPFFEDNTYGNNDPTNNNEEYCDVSTEKVASTSIPHQENLKSSPRINTFSPTTMNNNREQLPQVPCDESRMTHNVDATRIILPTAETTQTNQQNQFTSQNSWPYIPVCFYGPPSSSNSYEFKQNPGAPLFTPYILTQSTNVDALNQPVKLFFTDGQQQKYTVNAVPQQIQPNIYSAPYSPQSDSQFARASPTNLFSQSPIDLQYAQPSGFPQFSQSATSSKFPQTSHPSQFSQIPVTVQNQQHFSQQKQQNSPYYCTYILVPSNYQQQISFTPNWNTMQFTDRAKESETTTKEVTNSGDQLNQYQEQHNDETTHSNQQQQNSNQQQKSLIKTSSNLENQQFSKSSKKNETVTNQSLQQRNSSAESSRNRYQNMFEQSYSTTVTDQCTGFVCNPPYAKCLESNQRCDGRVDCMGAEDEIGCPKDGYYTRFHKSQSDLSKTNTETRTMSTMSTFEEDRKQTTMSNFEEERKQSTMSKFEEERMRNSSSILGSSQKQQNNTTSSVTELGDDFGKTPIPKGRNERTTKNVDHTTTIPNNQLLNVVTERSFESESTTIALAIPDLPHQFICKRIMQTIPLAKRCNNVFDCEDTSDEEDCKCKDYLRLHHPSAICDGQVDCPDASDEDECELCRENEYHCYKSGGCIAKHKRCDQTMDCKLNEDELDCFALTDGSQINLDLDKRPHLNLEGVLTRYDNGVWRPSCFKSEFSNETKRIGAGQKICEYLGFKNVELAEEIVVEPSRLSEKLLSKEIPANRNHVSNYKSSKREINSTCHGLRIRCKPILDRKLNVHLKIDPKSKERSYVWPWEASIFVDGRYYCSAVLLENNLLLSSSKCSENIDLDRNYTAALFGAPSTKFHYKFAHEQSSPIINIKSLHHSDASLFRLKDNINMTRYVQPLYLEKRIFPASKDDTCVALGINSNHQRQTQFLQPIVTSCPKCHRCFIEKSDASTCETNNSTLTWSGYVVCLSSGGWYPAAVFKNKNENCGFVTKQVLNSIDYIHAHLSQAIDEVVQPFTEPYCEGIRCPLGQCVPWEKVCDGIPDCREGVDENPEQCQKMEERCKNGISECKCSKAELSCGNGKCIAKEMFCDGKVDCPNGVDEPPTCSCGEYLKLSAPKRFCDGRRHCLDKSDENYRHCMCKDSSFKCERSMYNDTTACVPQDFVCDGEVDCPNGEDESDEVCWTLKSDRHNSKGRGEVMRRSFGVLQSECFPRPIDSQREVTNMCTKLGYRSGILVDGSRLSESQFAPRNDFYMFQLNNNMWIVMRNDLSFGVWKKPEGSCYRLFVQCF